jgi:hypothetical protein
MAAGLLLSGNVRSRKGLLTESVYDRKYLLTEYVCRSKTLAERKCRETFLSPDLKWLLPGHVSCLEASCSEI